MLGKKKNSKLITRELLETVCRIIAIDFQPFGLVISTLDNFYLSCSSYLLSNKIYLDIYLTDMLQGKHSAR